VRHLRCSFQIREDRVDASRPAQDEAVSRGRRPISSFTPQRQSAPLWALFEGVSADGSGPTRTRERIELLHACPRQDQGSDGEDNDARRWRSSAGCFRCVQGGPAAAAIVPAFDADSAASSETGAAHEPREASHIQGQRAVRII